MTVLSAEKIVEHSQARLWHLVSQFGQAPKWVDGVEKAEHLSGDAANIGGVWRVHLRWELSYVVIDLEITEWLEGERFGLRPLRRHLEKSDTEIYQLVFNLKALAASQTLASVQCEYKPRNRMAKIKNLVFLRRQYLRRLNASLETLARVAAAQA
jgi:hypothetical protein